MDLDLLKKLIDLMNSNDLLELEVVEEGTKIRLKKIYEGGPRIIPMAMAAGGAQPHAHAPVAPPAAAAPAATAAASHAGRHFIKSPMVGTFYRSPNPDSPSYVEVGDAVTADTTVCILEAMKVFNEIRAECEGRIVEILVQTGEAVEYGQPLFAVETA
jgi:acetyl-CoA carboxylase biotin carboxyl carrier protein